MTMLFVGVDLTSAFAKKPRPIDIAVLDDGLECHLHRTEWPAPLQVISRNRGLLHQMIASAIGWTNVDQVWAIDGPQGLARHGFSQRECERLFGAPGRTPSFLPHPASPKPFEGYIRSSVDLFGALLSSPGFQLAGLAGTGLESATLFEVYPGSEWPVLAGRGLPEKESTSGRLSRLALLESLGLRGLPAVPTADQNDAAVAAYLAWCTRHARSSVALIGNPPTVTDGGQLTEGYILHITARPVARPPTSLSTVSGGAQRTQISGELVINDLESIDGSVPMNSWLGWHPACLLSASKNGRTCQFTLTPHPVAQERWVSNPTVPRLLRTLEITVTEPLSKENRVVLKVELLEAGLFSGTSSPAQKVDPTGRWEVKADAQAGLLDLSVDPGGAVTGQLHGIPIAGRWDTVARKLQFVLNPQADSEGQYVFEGYWLADGSALAGTYIGFGGPEPIPGRSTFGWYATRH